ncbi:hypothetical protein LSTR_LSTR005737 [Laodelphax striatellus]|uniref:DNA-directed DNA polymerase n=1 Tax=Laodelphax striatellus TaxID=195883 RepID=A0A482XHM8_LAOST|nr:hypothetical protein LSTR_LSTR005737 [Laodelphax striatellus]
MIRGDRSKSSRLQIQPSNNYLGFQGYSNADLKTYYYRNIQFKDICTLLKSLKNQCVNLLKSQLDDAGSIKFNILVECTYRKQSQSLDEISYQNRSFKTKNTPLFSGSSISSIYNECISSICDEEANYQGFGSGWTLSRIDGVLLRTNKYKPLRGGSYIELPKKIANRKSVINCKNTDNQCFIWAILSKYVRNRPERISHHHQNLKSKFNFSKISFPTPLKDVRIFEKLNPSVSINVYGLDSSQNVYPLRLSEFIKRNHFDLLLLQKDTNTHWCYIKNLARLVVAQINKHKGKIHICKRCLTHFGRISAFESHERICKKKKKNDLFRAIMPKSNPTVGPPIMRFKNYQNQYSVPIVVYADFESILKPYHSSQPPLSTSFTEKTHKHEPFSYCCYTVMDESLPDQIRNTITENPFLYRGSNAPNHFIKYLIDLANNLGEMIKTNIPIIFTKEDEDHFNSQSCCEMCECEFTMIVTPVKDHDHLSGRYRSKLCSPCNLKRLRQRYIPVILHNLSQYDAHFIILSLGCDQEKIDIIPNTSEKYITFSKHTKNGLTLRFIDSMRFMNSSLSNLANDLSREDFVHVKKFFPESKLDLVCKKANFPYEYVDCYEKLEDKTLPSIENFYSSLMSEEIDEEEYIHAQNMWDSFRIQNLGQYSDLYLKLDVLILSDIFQTFRKSCMKTYGLDCCHYITIASYTFDAMLFYTKVELELISDYGMFIFIEQGLRGGITTSVHRHSIANNQYIPETFDPEKERTFLNLIDANNLYGWALSKPLPLSDFVWMSQEDIASLDIMKIPNESSEGYIFEVDIDYPKKLHDKHSDLPFFPEKKCPPNNKNEKLMLTLEPKKDYVCHYLNLKQAIENGLIVRKIKRVLKFTQSKWMEPYIRLNTTLRQKSTNEFEKQLRKVMNNAIFGKTIENTKKRVNMKLVNSQKQLEKLVNNTAFKDRTIYSENLCLVESQKQNVILSKPIYIGFAVLELSKHLMYDFFYNVMQKYYGVEKLKLLYIDTDSFFFEIKTFDLYKDLARSFLNRHLDLSDYPKDHELYSLENMKVLGKFSDETASRPVREFVSLRPKLYSYKICGKEGDIEKKKAKGVSRQVIEKNISFNDYYTVLKNDESSMSRQDRIESVRSRYRTMITFRSSNHVINTVKLNKLSLCSKDDKRIILHDGVTTLPYGHYLADKVNKKIFSCEA